jgi:hypothetical protein
MKTLYERFDEKWMPEPTTGCWLWIGATIQHGYGRIFAGPEGTGLLAVHRVAYERWVGPIPDGFEIDHVRARGCATTACVNPEHLEAVTHAENMRRGRPGRTQTAKTHCPSGHAYDGENLIVRRGSRYCRECHRLASKRRRDLKRARGQQP